MTDASGRRRWDPLVKLTHWGIVAAVLANAVIVEEGSGTHIWIGYALAAILGLRLFWGLVGPAEARFSAFPPSPRRALAHIGEIATGKVTAHRSHNPLGALMVYAIWATLLVIIATGIIMAGLPTTPRAEPPTAIATIAATEADEAGDAGEGAENGEGEEGPAAELHEAAVNLLYGLILLHIAGVVVESRRQRRNLALAMLSGRG